MTQSLRARVLLVAGTVLVLTVAAVTGAAALLFSQAYQQALGERSRAVAHDVAAQFERILAVGLRPDDILGFEDQCNKAAASHPDLAIVAVLGLDGHARFQNGAAGPRLQLPLLALAEGVADGRERHFALELPGGRYAAVTTPVHDASRAPVGAVLVAASQAHIDRALNLLYAKVAAVGLGFIVLGMALLHLVLTRFVTRPLAAVVEAVDALRQQAPEQGRPITVAAPGETAVVVETVNALLAQQRQHLAALTVARDMADAANLAKSRFLANMSHELRTPLNGILGLTGLVRRKVSDPQAQDQLDKVLVASRHLLALIDDVLDVSRIEAGRLRLEAQRLTLAPLIEQVQALLEPRARAKGLQLRTEADPALLSRPFEGDPLRIQQVLLNLAGNAIKFTEQGHITVRAALQSETADAVLLRFEVADTGIGIRPEDRERLFSPFEQADGSTTRTHGGSGLGLTISRRLVDLMGGQIDVDSTPGQGSSFWFTLRLRPAAPEPAASGPTESALATLRRSCAGARVLLAEDDATSRELARVLLEQAGLQVDEAHDGRQALDLARRQPPALVLMDVQMPGMDGLEATRALRADPRWATLPVLALTGNAGEDERQACLAAGMNDHLPKPIDAEQLYAKLLHWLAPG